jgi:hypothetical protein
MGSSYGDIQIFYVDEPVSKGAVDGRVREKELQCSPFNFYHPSHVKHNHKKTQKSGINSAVSVSQVSE